MSPGLDQGGEGGSVGLGAGVRLDVGVFGAEERLGPLDRQVLGDVDVLAAAVVAASRVTLGVLVGQDRALGFEHRARGEVLGGDHFQGVALAAEFLASSTAAISGSTWDNGRSVTEGVEVTGRISWVVGLSHCYRPDYRVQVPHA